MRRFRSSASLAVVASCAIFVEAGAIQAGSPAAPEAAARPKKSVYGKLESVSTRLNGLFMILDDGKRLAWRFEPAVIAEAAKVELGSPLIVIYREIGGKEKRVTAVAFPGATATATYMNLTGGRVVLRSAPLVEGACSPTATPVQETTIPTGGLAEVPEGCWCCAAAGEACTPANKSGAGRALLVGCFE